MGDPDIKQSFLRSYNRTLALAVILIILGVLFVFNLKNNPPGFYIDESSIAYNAHLIAQSGKDEYGKAWPLFFRAFGEYKNPVYIYLLAVVFRLTGPSILAGRLFSAALIYLAGLAMGLLALRTSKRRDVALIVLATTLLTPWLFELSRVVLEVAVYPLALAVFLLILQRGAQKNRWSWLESAAIASMLALLTYSYSIGRLFAPLLALGLILFVSRVGWKSVGRVWLLYALVLIPLLVFHWRYPGALTSRFHFLT
jgi:4-amino-4-deoxy-L-arabinose transferase-like glycosyltransferase